MAWHGRVTAYQAAETASERASSASHTRIAVDVARPPPDDPGDADRGGAARLLADAHASVDIAARLTQAALADAERHAPTRPSIWHRFTHGIGDALHGAAHVAEGVGDGLLDMGKGLWSLTGAAVTDPHQFAGSWQGMSTLTDVAHPYAMQQAWVGFGRSFVDADEWSKEPGRAFGHTLANVGALAAGGEGVAARGGEAAEAGAIDTAAMRPGTVASRAESVPLAEALRAPHVKGEPWELSPNQMPAASGLEQSTDTYPPRRATCWRSSGSPNARAIMSIRLRSSTSTLSEVDIPPRSTSRTRCRESRIYDESTDRFLVINTDGSIVTYYRPDARRLLGKASRRHRGVEVGMNAGAIEKIQSWICPICGSPDQFDEPRSSSGLEFPRTSSAHVVCSSSDSTTTVRESAIRNGADSGFLEACDTGWRTSNHHRTGTRRLS